MNDKKEKILKQEKKIKKKVVFSHKKIIDKKQELTNSKKTIKKNPIRSSIKTYKSFTVDALKNNPTSLASMVIKEKRKQRKEEYHSLKNKRNVIIVILSIILVLLGVTVVASIVIFSFFKKVEVSENNKPISPDSVILFDFSKAFDVSKFDRYDFQKIVNKAIKETNIAVGNIQIFYFTKFNENKKKVLLNARDFLKIIDTSVPDKFVRNLIDHFSLGVIKLESFDTAPFLIFKIDNFDVAYGAIFTWEKTLIFDLGYFFGVNKKYSGQRFSDISVFNKDVKAILDEKGKVIFGYSFIDAETLVFFTDILSLEKIILSLKNNKEQK